MAINKNLTFDDIMEIVGCGGKFQKRFNFLFIFVLVFISTLSYMNIVFALVLPDHWCKVPGREFTNMTMEEWKDYTIPRQKDSMEFRKCQMYNISNLDNSTIRPQTDDLFNQNNIVACTYGWEYDKTWYKNTAPSEENWVCDNELNVANSFVMQKIGEFVGTLLFGQLGDIYGRKIIFFITIITVTTGRCLATFTSSNLSWFLLFTFIGGLSSTTIFLSPYTIAIEISKTEDRSFVAMLQCLSWTMGLCVLPIIMWLIGDWKPFLLITTLPGALYLFSNSFIIESPRWLAGKAKVHQCVKELQKIATLNNRSIPDDLEGKIIGIGLNKEKIYGVMSLFSSWRLAKNTILIIIGWMISLLIYFTFTLNISYLGGNPFVNYFWQGLAELPAYIVGKYCCDYIGRRWTTTISFFTNFVGCLPLIYIITEEQNQMLSTGLIVFLKFTIALVCYSLQLQTLEIYPTCIRQTGQALSAVASNAIVVLAPYIVYFGASINVTYPYTISACLSLIGIFCGFLLPETLNTKLPETLAEASEFGANQKYFEIGYGIKYARTNTRDEK